MGRVVVVGGGIFGVTGALELRCRGWEVVLVEPGPLPHPLAASTDISKAVRLDYGPDEDYAARMESALEGWRAWNDRWRAVGEAPLFQETGVAFLSRAPMAKGGFEHESFELLRRRGHALERLDAKAIHERFPAWKEGAYVDGYFNPEGGYAQSGAVVARLAEEARSAGVAMRIGERLEALPEAGGARTRRATSGAHRPLVVRTAGGATIEADRVVLAAGTWTHHLLPWLAPYFRSVGQPVFHLRPADPTLFQAARFPVFGADIARTGYYGFPVTGDGIVKIANHGPGRELHPETGAREVSREEELALRTFLAETFPSLVDAPIVSTRLCLYCDTRDEHFWIARDPEREGVVVATGGSGHAFKFAPLLGGWIADVVEGRAGAALSKFRWRPDVTSARGEEAARRHKS